MRSVAIILFSLLAVSAWAQAPIYRQFFTTNAAPVVEVVAGSNATVQFSTPAVNTRRYTVNAIPSGTATNVYGTNVIGAVAEATHATNADNATYVTTATLTNKMYGSNIVFHGSDAMPTATNSLKLINDYATIDTGTDVDITNVWGQVAGEYRWVSLWASNSAATAITVRYTGPGRKVGVNTTNALSVAAGKFGLLSFACRGTAWTNYATAAEQ